VFCFNKKQKARNIPNHQRLPKSVLKKSHPRHTIPIGLQALNNTQ
jgi:hypothetical protein